MSIEMRYTATREPTYTIYGTCSHSGFEQWLVIGCLQDEVGKMVEDFTKEIGTDNKPMFSNIRVSRD